MTIELHRLLLWFTREPLCPKSAYLLAADAHPENALVREGAMDMGVTLGPLGPLPPMPLGPPGPDMPVSMPSPCRAPRPDIGMLGVWALAKVMGVAAGKSGMLPTAPRLSLRSSRRHSARRFASYEIQEGSSQLFVCAAFASVTVLGLSYRSPTSCALPKFLPCSRWSQRWSPSRTTPPLLRSSPQRRAMPPSAATHLPAQAGAPPAGAS